jgi:hypothetical protein
LDPGSRDGYRIRIRILDHISESFEIVFWVKILKFFHADPGSGMGNFGSGMKKLRIGIRDGKIRIRDEKTSDPG